jgi:hypothetical protein
MRTAFFLDHGEVLARPVLIALPGAFMPSSLQSLVAAPRSGRRRPLLIEHDDYAVAVVRQGAALSWTDLAALSGHVGQVHGLLDPDAVWLDVEALYLAHLAAEPGLVAELGARSRTGYALRTLLADAAGVERVVLTLRTLADVTRRPVVLDLPSPARWLGRAHAIAGTPVETVDVDRADTASMYLAEWLGKLGGLPVALVLLDSRPAEGDPAVGTPEQLEAYTSVTNVAGHFEWTVGLRGPDGVQLAPGEPAVSVLPEAFWAGDGVCDGEVLLGTIPATASPERVLEQLARLR